MLTFKAIGGTSHGGGTPIHGPDGGRGITWHTAGAQHGISNFRGPYSSLIGVFLGPERPDQSPAPLSLDFSAQNSRDYLVFAPDLKQVFFGSSCTRVGKFGGFLAHVAE